MLTLLIPLATVLFLHITGANAYREMERRQARFREAYGDVPRVPNEAKRTATAGSAGGRSSCLKQRPSYSLTGDIAHRKGGI